MWKNALYSQLYLQKWMGVEIFVDMVMDGLALSFHNLLLLIMGSMTLS